MTTIQELIDRGDVTRLHEMHNPLVTFAWVGPPIPEIQHPPECKPPKGREWAGRESCCGWYRHGQEWRIDAIDPVALQLPKTGE